MEWKQLYNMTEEGTHWKVWDKCPSPEMPKEIVGELEFKEDRVYVGFVIPGKYNHHFRVTPQAHGPHQINPSHLERID